MLPRRDFTFMSNIAAILNYVCFNFGFMWCTRLNHDREQNPNLQYTLCHGGTDPA
jgi:hypothetical protein